MMMSLKSPGIETLSPDVTELMKACVAVFFALNGGSLEMRINNASSGCSIPMVAAKIAEVEKLFRILMSGRSYV